MPLMALLPLTLRRARQLFLIHNFVMHMVRMISAKTNETSKFGVSSLVSSLQVIPSQNPSPLHCQLHSVLYSGNIVAKYGVILCSVTLF